MTERPADRSADDQGWVHYTRIGQQDEELEQRLAGERRMRELAQTLAQAYYEAVCALVPTSRPDRAWQRADSRDRETMTRAMRTALGEVEGGVVRRVQVERWLREAAVAAEQIDMPAPGQELRWAADQVRDGKAW